VYICVNPAVLFIVKMQGLGAFVIPTVYLFVSVKMQGLGAFDKY